VKNTILIVSLFVTIMANAQNTYLALGDSYTICEGLEYEKTWPYHLSQYLSSEGMETSPPKIIAKTGWRTDELIVAIREELDKNDRFNMVSLLIGVNNEFQEKPISQYREDLEDLLKVAISKCKFKENGVFMVSIPDYSVTPFAAEKDKTNAFETLNEYNAYAQQLCKTYGIRFYDITLLSQQLSEGEDYLISDKLHPNEEQYLKWLDTFKIDVYERLSEN